jgi:hypothetical protein
MQSRPVFPVSSVVILFFERNQSTLAIFDVMVSLNSKIFFPISFLLNLKNGKPSDLSSSVKTRLTMKAAMFILLAECLNMRTVLE